MIQDLLKLQKVNAVTIDVGFRNAAGCVSLLGTECEKCVKIHGMTTSQRFVGVGGSVRLVKNYFSEVRVFDTRMTIDSDGMPSSPKYAKLPLPTFATILIFNNLGKVITVVRADELAIVVTEKVPKGTEVYVAERLRTVKSSL